jgi:hypothetical protein
VLQHVSALVLLAALNERARAEGLHDGLAQRLAAVDDPQPHALGVEPALDQIRQQRRVKEADSGWGHRCTARSDSCNCLAREAAVHLRRHFEPLSVGWCTSP